MTPEDLRTWRRHHFDSQEKAAKWLGLSRSQWMRYEHPETHPDSADIPRTIELIVSLTTSLRGLVK